jgi:hypothetical protein
MVKRYHSVATKTVLKRDSPYEEKQKQKGAMEKGEKDMTRMEGIKKGKAEIKI